MKRFFSQIKEKFRRQPDYSSEEGGEEYLELSPDEELGKAKVVIRPFVLEEFGDIKGILDSMREGYTISLINIKPLKEKDLTELKRAISKLKKTAEAVEGEIAGFGEDWLVMAPKFAQIYKPESEAPAAQEKPAQDEEQM